MSCSLASFLLPQYSRILWRMEVSRSWRKISLRAHLSYTSSERSDSHQLFSLLWRYHGWRLCKRRDFGFWLFYNVIGHIFPQQSIECLWIGGEVPCYPPAFQFYFSSTPWAQRHLSSTAETALFIKKWKSHMAATSFRPFELQTSWECFKNVMIEIVSKELKEWGFICAFMSSTILVMYLETCLSYFIDMSTKR